MKIAVIRKKYDEFAGGGAEKYAAELVKGLIERGHKLTVFAEKFNIEKKKQKLKWKKVPENHLSFSGTTAFHNSVQKEINHKDYDIVYSLSRTYPSDVFRVTEQIHKVWLDIAYSLTGGINPRHRSIIKLEKETLKEENTKRVVCNSELTKNQIIDFFNYPAEKIKVIRNGLDRRKFYPPENNKEKKELRTLRNLPQDKIILLFAAGNFKIKGFNQLIDGLCKLKKTEKNKILLLVAGNDKKIKNFKLICQKTGVETRFEGHVQKMRDYYAMSDLFVYPSLYEPFANVCLEACACSLPVLTTKLNGSSEIIEDGKNGFLLENAFEIEGITEKLRNFINLSSEEIANFAQNAVKASDSFSWTKHIDELEKLFLEIKSDHSLR